MFFVNYKIIFKLLNVLLNFVSGSDNLLGSNGEKKDTTLAKLLPYLMISGTGEDDMPDMGLIAEAIMDPEGKGASSFFTEMSMKNILGDDLGEIMAASQEERPDKMQEYVLGQMGKSKIFLKSFLISIWSNPIQNCKFTYLNSLDSHFEFRSSNFPKKITNIKMSLKRPFKSLEIDFR